MKSIVWAVVIGLLVASPAWAAKKQAAPRQVTGFIPDGADEEIFKKADKGKDKLLSDKEYVVAVQLAQQLAQTLPLPPSTGKKGATAPAVTPIGNPDLNNDKKISLEEWKAVFPLIVKNTQAEMAKAQAGAKK